MPTFEGRRKLLTESSIQSVCPWSEMQRVARRAR